MKHPFLGKLEGFNRREVIVGGIVTAMGLSASAQVTTLAMGEEGGPRYTTRTLGEEGGAKTPRKDEGAGNKEIIETMKVGFDQAVNDTRTKLAKSDLRGAYSTMTYAKYCNKFLFDTENDTELTKTRAAKVEELKVLLKEPVRLLHEKAVVELAAKETLLAYRKFYILQFIREFPYAAKSADSLKEIRESETYKENSKKYQAYVAYDNCEFVDKKYRAQSLKNIIKRYPETAAAKRAAEDLKDF